MKLSVKVNLIVSITITIIISLIFLVLAHRYNTLIKRDLLQTARSFYKSIVITRAWVAHYNGVYVEKTGDVKSNPYLPFPDITTKDNRELTLKNPALVTRELSELSEEMGGRFRFHMTSLTPINPSNAPNDFEKKALESFKINPPKRPYHEHYQIEQIKNKSYFRYIGPLYTEPSCLNCHQTHGYKTGDIRGGISIILPMDFIEEAKYNNYLFMILSGIATIIFLSLTINFSIRRVIINPVQEIESAAKAVGSGKYVPIEIHKKDEIGELADEFNLMQKKIKTYTRELEQSEKKYRTLINYSPEAVLIVDNKNIIVDANDNIKNICSLEPEEVIRQPLDKIIQMHKPPSFKNGDSQNRFEADLICKDDNKKSIEIYLSPKYYETDTKSQLRLYYLRDMSVRKKMERYMIETEKTFALDQLSAGIAHEIRNPLFGIRNNLNYLKSNFSDNPEFENVCHEISAGLNKINSLVNSILDYAKPHQTEFKKYSIAKVIQDALELVKKQFETSHHRIEIDIPENTPEIEIDPHRMEQVFINLFTNSLHAMNRDGCQLKIGITFKRKKMKISFSDNGAGIEGKYIAHIFDPFFTRSPNGTGLGLAIVKNIIQQHNGSIKVSSKEYQGTTFEITLPMNQQ